MAFLGRLGALGRFAALWRFASASLCLCTRFFFTPPAASKAAFSAAALSRYTFFSRSGRAFHFSPATLATPGPFLTPSGTSFSKRARFSDRKIQYGFRGCSGCSADAAIALLSCSEGRQAKTRRWTVLRSET